MRSRVSYGPFGSFCLLVAPVLAGCALVPAESEVSAEAPLVSGTRVLLVPTSEAARTGCRDEINTVYCSERAARTAATACVERIGHAAASQTTVDKTFRFDVRSEACAGPGPMYPTEASCAAPVVRSCVFYSACVDAAIPCGEDGYALGYGEKYCAAFRRLDTISERGERWRDGVMSCLQTALVPFVLGAQATCDVVLDTAFDSHPDCYTRRDHNICALAPSDTLAIMKTIGQKELLTARSLEQIKATIGRCVASLFDHLFRRSRVARDAEAPHDDGLGELDEDATRAHLEFWRALQDEYETAESTAD